MLLTIKWKKSMWEIHGGTIFDFFINTKWNYKGEKSQKMLMIQYLEGLIKLTDEIKKNNNRNSIELIGISYILGKNNARKIGFKIEPISLKRKVMFIFDYLSLTIMYSFTKGKIAFPNIFKAIKLKIGSDELIASKIHILKMIETLRKREKFGNNYL